MIHYRLFHPRGGQSTRAVLQLFSVPGSRSLAKFHEVAHHLDISVVSTHYSLCGVLLAQRKHTDCYLVLTKAA